MFLGINIEEFIRVVAENCSAGLAWLLGAFGTVTVGTIVTNIIMMIRNKVKNSDLINSLEKTNSKLATKVDDSLTLLEDKLSKYANDNRTIADMLLMIASKMGLEPQEFLQLATKYKEVEETDNRIADVMVEEINKAKEEELKAQEEAAKEEAAKEQTIIDELDSIATDPEDVGFKVKF